MRDPEIAVPGPLGDELGLNSGIQPRGHGGVPRVVRTLRESRGGLGEGRVALLHRFGRLRVRWEVRDEIHQAFLTLGCAIICWRRLRNLKEDT
jgi:hypothetical protein